MAGRLPSCPATRLTASTTALLASRSLSQPPISSRAERASTVPPPGAEVLGREVLAGRLPQVGVDVLGADALPLLVLVEILKQLLPRQVAALLDDAREPPVVHLHRVLLAALAPELEAQRRAVD